MVRGDYDNFSIVSRVEVIDLLTNFNSDFKDLININTMPFNFYCYSSIYGKVSIRRILEYFMEHRPLKNRISGSKELVYSNTHSAVRILTTLGIKVFTDDLSPTAGVVFQSALERGLLIYDKELELDEYLLDETTFKEGKSKTYQVTRYERSQKARKAAIQIHGVICKACDFDFFEYYGEIGKNFIEVHHKNPLAYKEIDDNTNPIRDLTVLCSNCHQIIHRGGKCMTVEELKEIINNNNKIKREIITFEEHNYS